MPGPADDRGIQLRQVVAIEQRVDRSGRGIEPVIALRLGEVADARNIAVGREQAAAGSPLLGRELALDRLVVGLPLEEPCIRGLMIRVCQAVASCPSEQPTVSISIGSGALSGCQCGGTTRLAGSCRPGRITDQPDVPREVVVDRLARERLDVVDLRRPEARCSSRPSNRSISIWRGNSRRRPAWPGPPA